GIVGQMMEKVVLPEQRPRRTAEEISRQCPWAVTGKPSTRERNIMTTLELEPAAMEVINHRLQEKYKMIEENEVRFQTYDIDDAEYLVVAFGSIARICQKAVEVARANGVKVGLIRPITLWPFPTDEIERLSARMKGILVVEINAGQMIEDVRLACHDNIPVYHFGRLGGIVPNPQEVLDAFFNHFPEANS
ncbi:MAG: 3-methyl-2-oxobutanoate dehydrogenase subunit beta, partial [Muribaculum sp.]|nr:3-methyl-2-oxobutanoate dehydrogenase subunit beta [Muribaculum sp.]